MTDDNDNVYFTLTTSNSRTDKYRTNILKQQNI